MNRKLLIFVGILALSACSQQGAQHELIEAEDVRLVLVDGQAVTLPMMEYVMAGRGIDEDDHEAMREILDELIRLRAVANAAIEAGIDREPRVRAERMLRDFEVLQRHYFDQLQQEEPLREADIAAVYEAQRERSGSRQYRIETVLMPSQSEALSMLVRLEEGGEDFDALYQAQGSPPPLWVNRAQFRPDLAELLVAAEPGEVLGLPLETPQGWRIVRVAESRPLELPPLAEVRDGIVRQLLTQRMEAVLDALYEAAEITPMLPLEPDDTK